MAAPPPIIATVTDAPSSNPSYFDKATAAATIRPATSNPATTSPMSIRLSYRTNMRISGGDQPVVDVDAADAERGLRQGWADREAVDCRRRRSCGNVGGLVNRRLGSCDEDAGAGYDDEHQQAAEYPGDALA